MTTEKAIEFGKIFLKSIEDEKGSATYEFVETAVKALNEKDILDKIREDINNLTVYYTTKDKGINLISQRAVNRVIDKYKVESEYDEE
jgi:transposase-like protein